MPVAYLQEFAASGDRSTRNYDAMNEQLGIDEHLPEGLLVHSAGFGEDGTFRIYDVWETRERAERFYAERLGPLVDELIASGRAAAPPVRRETYDLHHVAGAVT